jgi:hypothetical protein
MLWLSWQHFPNRRDNETHVLSGFENAGSSQPGRACCLDCRLSCSVTIARERGFVMARIGCVLCRDVGMIRRHLGA